MDFVRQLTAKRIDDLRGNLLVWGELPFPVCRVFQIDSVPTGETRGNHAHKTCHQVIACTNGSFVLNVTDKDRLTNTFVMHRGMAVSVPPLHWIMLASFSAGAACTVLANEPYTPPITDYQEFLAS